MLSFYTLTLKKQKLYGINSFLIAETLQWFQISFVLSNQDEGWVLSKQYLCMLEFWSVILQYSKKNLTAQRFTIISYYFVLLTTGFVFRRFDLIWPEWFYCFPECLTMKHVFRSNLGDDLLEFFLKEPDIQKLRC